MNADDLPYVLGRSDDLNHRLTGGRPLEGDREVLRFVYQCAKKFGKDLDDIDRPTLLDGHHKEELYTPTSES